MSPAGDKGHTEALVIQEIVQISTACQGRCIASFLPGPALNTHSPLLLCQLIHLHWEDPLSWPSATVQAIR